MDGELIEKRNSAVFIPSTPYRALDAACLDEVTKSAGETPLLRSRVCCHNDGDSSPQEMLISLKRGSYIRPHRHFNKAESGLCLRGSADAVFFDDSGSIVEAWPMGPESTGKRFFYRIENPVFHCLYVRSESFVFHEVSTGPFRREHTEFASWAPDESDQVAVREYMAELECALKSWIK